MSTEELYERIKELHQKGSAEYTDEELPVEFEKVLAVYEECRACELTGYQSFYLGVLFSLMVEFRVRQRPVPEFPQAVREDLASMGVV